MTLPSSGPLSMNDIAGEFGGSTPHALNEYYAGGGLVPAGTSGTYGAVPSSGTISIQNFYGTSNFVPIYIEEVFQTWLYTGNNTSRNIVNGVNLSANGGLVWTKTRSVAGSHCFIDTARGTSSYISSNLIDAAATDTNLLTAFNTNGYTLGTDPSNGLTNFSSFTYASWTFRKQPKFFDIVTWTGNGVVGRNIPHNLASTPGCIIVKDTGQATNWPVYHRSRSTTQQTIFLNSTGAFSNDNAFGNPTSTNIVVGGNPNFINENGQTYVAYLFAHNAGGFGLTGTDNVITCGSYTGNGVNVGPSINLGYEPQWLLYKNASSSAGWGIIDNMRGWATSTFYTAGDQVLRANTANAEFADDLFSITSTGFDVVGADPSNNYNGQTYIYIAIRRGPMKTPTTGTSVFTPISATSSIGSTRTVGFPADMLWARNNTTFGTDSTWDTDRLRGFPNGDTQVQSLRTNSAGAELTVNNYAYNIWNTTAVDGSASGGVANIWWYFGRAPGFFDVVCYTGVGGGPQTLTHNLGVAPQLVFVKSRNQSYDGFVYSVTLGLNNAVFLFSTSYGADPSTSLGGVWGTSNPTSTTFTVGNYANLNNTGDTYVAYMFATLAGVSKVGSYTGTGALQTINCGFTGGARFVLIKRTDASGGWYVYDSARGISSGNDPYFLLNTSAAQVTGTNYVDTTSVGFQVTAAAPADLNANGGTYIFLAIA